MAAPKLKPSQFAKLYEEGNKTRELHDKQIVESLRKRLNDKIQNNSVFQKKAALIIENWLKNKTKP